MQAVRERADVRDSCEEGGAVEMLALGIGYVIGIGFQETSHHTWKEKER